MTGVADVTPPRLESRRRRRLVTPFATAVLLLLVAELGVRALGDGLPEPLDYHSAEADTKVDRMDELAASGGADVVFVGSSTVNSGVDPRVVARQLGPDIVVYNAALSAALPNLVEPWTVGVVLPRLAPEVLVIGVSSFEFSDSPAREVFFRAFAESPEGERVLGDDNVVDDADRWLRQRSSLWAHRFALRDPETLLDALRDGPPPDALVESIDASGHTTYRGHGSFTARPGTGPPVGTWSLGRQDPAAITRTVRTANSGGTRVILVSMPVTDEYIARHPNGEADYDTFRTALRSLGDTLGITVLEFDDIRDHALFADVVHLNAAGAEAFSTQLTSALVPLIPPAE